jgi:hypothetical protein
MEMQYNSLLHNRNCYVTMEMPSRPNISQYKTDFLKSQMVFLAFFSFLQYTAYIKFVMPIRELNLLRHTSLFCYLLFSYTEFKSHYTNNINHMEKLFL